ncbi:MAG: hypothetical protein IT258_04660 [Saprospiraceae bacterium]|nr:hypothetical protein [Saprospiraceae bacterium]
MKLKTLLLIIIPISIIAYFAGCFPRKDEYENMLHRRDDFLHFIHSAYQVDGKYYLSGCSHWFGESEREIKQGDSFMGHPSHHCGTSYTVERLDSDSIYFSYEIDCLSMYRVVTKGAFSIPCQKDRSVAPEILFEGEKIDSFLAKKHLAEGRIYLLIAAGLRDSGNIFENDSCRIVAEEKYGFKEYPILGCMPLEDKQLLLKQYNDIVFAHLKAQQNFNYYNAYDLTGYFNTELQKCRHEKFNRDRALKNPPSGK